MLITAAMAIAVYANSLYCGFVYDDSMQVVGNSWIKDSRHIQDIFSGSVWAFMGRSSDYYRPMMHLIYMLDYQLFGLKPWGFHLTNILFHAGSSVLVYLIVSRLLPAEKTASPTAIVTAPFLAALFFAVHPVHTEAVTWIGGLPDVFYTFFCLLSLYLYMPYKDKGRASTGALLLSAASFFLASLCKEPALTLPIILLAYDYAYSDEKLISYQRLKKYAPYIAVSGLYFALRFNALGGFSPTDTHMQTGGHNYPLYISELFSGYLKRLLLPNGLNVLHVYHPSSSTFTLKAASSLLMAAGFLALLVYFARKSRAAFLGLTLIAVPLLPSFYIPALSQGLAGAFAERYLYLPVFGFSVLLAMALEYLKGRMSKGVTAAAVLALAIAALYSVGTVNRNPVWKDDLSLWSDTVKRSPDSSEARKGLGYALFNEGRVDEAMEQYQAALRLDPGYADLHINIGSVYEAKGMPDRAVESYREAVRLSPGSAMAHYSLGHAEYALGRVDDAVDEYLTAISLDPALSVAHNNLGVAYSNRGLTDMAMEEYRLAVKYDPGSASARYNLGKAYAVKGMLKEAAEYILAAMAMKPDDADMHNSLGIVYIEEGLKDQAAAEFEAAVRLAPGNLAYRKNLENTHAIKTVR